MSSRETVWPKLRRDLIVLGLIGVAAWGDSNGAEQHGHLFASLIRFVAIGVAFALMIWDRGRRTELDKLIFYRATTFAFCATLAGGLVYAIFESAGAVPKISTGDVAEYTMIAWVFALIVFRKRSE